MRELLGGITGIEINFFKMLHSKKNKIFTVSQIYSINIFIIIKANH